jgi:glycosyltransferase involved in cell wall biosynthesis
LKGIFFSICGYRREALSNVNKDPLPKISVITPCLNQGQFLEECIRSVSSQNYPHREHIIVDGGSTDNSIEIIQKYQAQLTCWVSEPDQGQSDAINKGFRLATGDVIAWLNSDDYYLPGAFEQVAQAYQAKPTAPFYFGNGLRVDKIGKIKRVHSPRLPLFFNHEALCYGLNYIFQPATFIRSQSLKKVGYLATNLHYGMDSDLWLRLSHLGEPQPIQAQLAASREYGSTKSATGSFARVEELRQIAWENTGSPITPGVICYFLDTLYQLVLEENDLFPRKYRRDILRFWGASSLLMQRYGAAPDGFPLRTGTLDSIYWRWKQAGWIRLRNFVKGLEFLLGKFTRK